VRQNLPECRSLATLPDKLVRYLNELEGKKMIMQDPLQITEKGRDFLQDYDRIKGFVFDMGVKYLDISEREIYER
jgi:hypothetical protein